MVQQVGSHDEVNSLAPLNAAVGYGHAKVSLAAPAWPGKGQPAVGTFSVRNGGGQPFTKHLPVASRRARHPRYGWRRKLCGRGAPGCCNGVGLPTGCLRRRFLGSGRERPRQSRDARRRLVCRPNRCRGKQGKRQRREPWSVGRPQRRWYASRYFLSAILRRMSPRLSMVFPLSRPPPQYPGDIPPVSLVLGDSYLECVVDPVPQDRPIPPP